MPRLEALAPNADPVHPLLARLLWQWLASGLLVLAVLAMFQVAVPAALAFWLLAAPVASLLTLHRQVLATAWRARLVRATPRRRPRFAARAVVTPRRRNLSPARAEFNSAGNRALRSRHP